MIQIHCVIDFIFDKSDVEDRIRNIKHGNVPVYIFTVAATEPNIKTFLYWRDRLNMARRVCVKYVR